MARGSRWLTVGVVGTEMLGVACQFVQSTDPRFPLVYFTICSALLTGAAAAASLAWPERAAVNRLRIAGAVGVVLSALIFAVVIAPATPTGTWFQPWDDGWVRTATVLLHGVAPVLVVAELLVRPPQRGLGTWMVSAYGWAALYLAAVSIAGATTRFTVPYPFLIPSESGWPNVVLALAAITALISVITAALYGARVVALRAR
ncbi:Pr6Pr family membrane protein [Mycolicibacterium rutilum]|uniref:Pr6Pr family membrane protein n=1 Tax=Mycolicibacterium rutilum TaxID=370526 RepID=UPI0012FF96E1|nr:Pr6Pr family membrane protein [Mycolicibacterium rutilum]